MAAKKYNDHIVQLDVTTLILLRSQKTYTPLLLHC